MRIDAFVVDVEKVTYVLKYGSGSLREGSLPGSISVLSVDQVFDNPSDELFVNPRWLRRSGSR